MAARLIWLLIVLFGLGIAVLFWVTRDVAFPNEQPEVGVVLQACAEDPGAAGCV
jgi:hypothetical protein